MQYRELPLRFLIQEETEVAYNGQSVNSTGVTGLTATLVPGNFAAGNGNLTYTVTGTPVGEGTASFAISVGGQACTVNVTVQPAVSPSNNYCVDKGLPDGNYVYPGYVQRYIKCITISGTKYTQPYTCPSGSGFNPNTKLCEVGYGAPYN
ncbi:chitin binding peritrophin-A domain-containing protein [Chryseobacterium wanjuense]